MTLKFSYEEVKARYNEFIQNFLVDENDIIKEELLPSFWKVSIPSKNFNATISCERTENARGIEIWYAVVEEEKGHKNEYSLFEQEIEEWLADQRKMKGY